MENNQVIRTAFNTVKYTFAVVPVVAGADKFTNLLVDWKQYINPAIGSLLPFSGQEFMMIVGIIEIVAGILVFRSAEIGGKVVAAWLTLIALTLLAGGSYLDVAVRDLVMAISAFSMARMAGVIR